MSPKFYAKDLAYIHDVGFLDFARRAAPAVLQALQRRCRPGARVVEIGCGSGGLTQKLAAAGYRVLGVDLSSSMIRLARRRAPAARFRVASWYDFTPPACDAIVGVGECFNYLSATPARHEAAIRSFLGRAGEALRPGGVLVFDFLEPAQGRPALRTVHACGNDWAIMVNVREDQAAVTREIISVRFVAGRCRCARETHRQMRLPRRQIEQNLRTAGFSTTFRDGFGQRPLGEGRVVAEALKVS
jgi:SAM-dependent methyltransferase